MFADPSFNTHAIWSQWNFQPFQTLPALIALALWLIGFVAHPGGSRWYYW